jgi:hypothetical protein
MTIKQVRLVAQMWERNNGKLLDQSHGSQQAYYQGFVAACLSIQDLIDGKRNGALKEAYKESKKK